MTYERPHWSRWFFAFLTAVLGGPIFAPMLWQLVMIEGGGMDSLMVGLLWAYLIGLPFVLVGMVILTSWVILGFDRLSTAPWWSWAMLGAVIGTGMMAVLSSFGSGEGPGVNFMLNGTAVGAAATVIYRMALLRPGSES